MTDDLVKRLRNRSERWMKYGYEEHSKIDTEAAERIEELERAMLEIFDYECRTSSTSLIACTARDALWPNSVENHS